MSLLSSTASTQYSLLPESRLPVLHPNSCHIHHSYISLRWAQRYSFVETICTLLNHSHPTPSVLLRSSIHSFHISFSTVYIYLYFYRAYLQSSHFSSHSEIPLSLIFSGFILSFFSPIYYYIHLSFINTTTTFSYTYYHSIFLISVTVSSITFTVGNYLHLCVFFFQFNAPTSSHSTQLSYLYLSLLHLIRNQTIQHHLLRS